MAKMKNFAIELEITVRRTVYIDARRPNGAIERLKTREGWREATAYQDDGVLDMFFEFQEQAMTVKNVRTFP